jgi:hypothetical protein
MLGGALMVYKCRLCGDTDDSTHCPSILQAISMLNRKSKTHDEPPGIIKYWQDLHRCADGRYGVADLVGFVPDPRGESG